MLSSLPGRRPEAQTVTASHGVGEVQSLMGIHRVLLGGEGRHGTHSKWGDFAEEPSRRLNGSLPTLHS